MSKYWDIDKKDIGKIDALIGEFKINLQIFEKSSDYKRIVSQAQKTQRTTMSSIGNCYFEQCPNQSISKSHSISNKLMLAPISEDSHVVTPVLDGYTGKYKIDNIGLNKATVFPGFCEEHENSFIFEKDGIITTEVELQKHLFRSICYQLHFLKSELSKLEKARDLFYEYFDHIFKEKIESENLVSDKQQLIGLFRASILSYYEVLPGQVQEDIDFTIKHWYEPHSKSFGKGLPSECHSELIVCTNQIKLAVSCPVLDEDKNRNHEGTPLFDHIYYVNVFPNNDKTHIYLVSLKSQKDFIINLGESFEGDGEVTKDYLLKLISNHTENWFLAPSIWSSVPEKGKVFIINKLSRFH